MAIMYFELHRDYINALAILSASFIRFLYKTKAGMSVAFFSQLLAYGLIFTLKVNYSY